VWEFLPRAWQLNLDLFERYGVDVPDSNWTVADLVAINNQFVDKANGVSGVQGDQHVIIDQFLRAYDVNAEVWEEGDERPHSRYSQDPNSINAVQALYDLIYANDSQFTDAEKQSFGPEWNDYWVQGHVAFAPWPPWGSPLDPKTGGYNFKWKVLPPPQGPTGTRDAGAGSICLAISSTATKEKADLAFKFIMSMTTAHYIENADLVDLTGSTPVVSPAGFRADVIKLPTGIPPVNMQYETHPDNVEALAGFLEAAALQSQSRYGQIGVPNNALITDVVEGGGSIADMLVEYDNAKNIELGHTD
jgi:ABC-type glycerol-3-phosphate transport system substrate-binding protein